MKMKKRFTTRLDDTKKNDVEIGNIFFLLAVSEFFQRFIEGAWVSWVKPVGFKPGTFYRGKCRYNSQRKIAKLIDIR